MWPQFTAKNAAGTQYSCVDVDVTMGKPPATTPMRRAAVVSKWNGSPKLHREKVLSARAHEKMRVQDLPSDWDWRNVNGTNFLTESRNQQYAPQHRIVVFDSYLVAASLNTAALAGHLAPCRP